MLNFEREGKAPKDILAELLLHDPKFAIRAEERGSLVKLPDAKPLGALVRPKAQSDPNELIRDRFLCRGGSLLLVGPTGVGKSSLTMQLCIFWSLGKECFGLRPSHPLRILIIQAENDEGDMAEMRDGVMTGLNLTEEEKQIVGERIIIVTEDAKTSSEFAALVDKLLEQYPCDLVVADPAFAYLGGDASSQSDVSFFLRNLLNPVIHKHHVGFLLVHHVNKPPQGEQKGQWQAGDFAYLGSGSAEFANWARAVMAIRSIGSIVAYELLLAKRGRRAGWLDDMGRPTHSRYIAYHREPNTICWRDADASEILPFLPPEKSVTVQDVVDLVATGTTSKAALVTTLTKQCGIKKSKAYEFIAKAIQVNAIQITGPHNKQTLILTGKLQPRPTVEDAHEED